MFLLYSFSSPLQSPMVIPSRNSRTAWAAALNRAFSTQDISLSPPALALGLYLLQSLHRLQDLLPNCVQSLLRFGLRPLPRLALLFLSSRFRSCSSGWLLLLVHGTSC